MNSVFNWLQGRKRYFFLFTLLRCFKLHFIRQSIMENPAWCKILHRKQQQKGSKLLYKNRKKMPSPYFLRNIFNPINKQTSPIVHQIPLAIIFQNWIHLSSTYTASEYFNSLLPYHPWPHFFCLFVCLLLFSLLAGQRLVVSLDKNITLKIKGWGTWVSQLVKCLTSVQVTISCTRFVGSSPSSGSGMTAGSLEPALDCVSLPLCPSPPPHTLSLSKINKH